MTQNFSFRKYILHVGIPDVRLLCVYKKYHIVYSNYINNLRHRGLFLGIKEIIVVTLHNFVKGLLYINEIMSAVIAYRLE